MSRSTNQSKLISLLPSNQMAMNELTNLTRTVNTLKILNKFSFLCYVTLWKLLHILMIASNGFVENVYIKCVFGVHVVNMCLNIARALVRMNTDKITYPILYGDGRM